MPLEPDEREASVYYCKVCNYSHDSLQQVASHMRTKHMSVESHKECPDCGSEDVYSHRFQTDYDFQCRSCGKEWEIDFDNLD